MWIISQKAEEDRTRREEAQKKYKKVKRLNYKKIAKVNYKGQPNLAAQMELLVAKIERNGKR